MYENLRKEVFSMGKHFSEWERGEIESLKAEGKTHRAIGEHLGYSRLQIKEYFHRRHRKERAIESIEAPKRKGRPRKNPITLQREYELRIKELERENELLRSFLRIVGRM
jgi:IS30 family transposase